MTPENIEKIAKSLNVDVKDLFDYEHHQSKEKLVNTIQEFLKSTSKNDVEFIYKSIKILKEYKR